MGHCLWLEKGAFRRACCSFHNIQFSHHKSSPAFTWRVRLQKSKDEDNSDGAASAVRFSKGLLTTAYLGSIAAPEESHRLTVGFGGPATTLYTESVASPRAPVWGPPSSFFSPGVVCRVSGFTNRAPLVLGFEVSSDVWPFSAIEATGEEALHA